jgi:hypothetical protein
MADENKDLNNTQPVTESTDLNSADVVNQQDLEAQPVQEQVQDVLADGTDANKDVPYSKLKEATDARKVAEEQAAHAQRTLELYQAQTTQAQQTYVQPKNVYNQALENCGLTTDDLYGENIVTFQIEKDRIVDSQRQQQQTTMAQQQFVISHPDANQVIGSVNPMTNQFIASPELLALLAKKPHLTAACNTVEIAYELVMQERQLNELQKTQTISQEQQTRQKVDNITQPMGGSAAGGMGGGSPQGQGFLSREQVLEIEAGLG